MMLDAALALEHIIKNPRAAISKAGKVRTRFYKTFHFSKRLADPSHNIVIKNNMYVYIYVYQKMNKLMHWLCYAKFYIIFNCLCILLFKLIIYLNCPFVIILSPHLVCDVLWLLY